MVVGWSGLQKVLVGLGFDRTFNGFLVEGRRYCGN